MEDTEILNFTDETYEKKYTVIIRGLDMPRVKSWISTRPGFKDALVAKDNYNPGYYMLIEEIHQTVDNPMIPKEVQQSIEFPLSDKE